MRNGGLPIELIKHDPEQCINIIQQMFGRCTEVEALLADWKLGYLSTYIKTEVQINVNITVASPLLWVGCKMNIKNCVEQEVFKIEEQSGFRPGIFLVLNNS